MIYIFSNKNDSTTNDVISWIRYYGELCTRINEEDFGEVYQQLAKSLQNTTNYLDGTSQINEKKNSFWFRRPDQRLMKKLVSQNQLLKEDVDFPNFPNGSKYWTSWENDLQLFQVRYYHSILSDKERKIGTYDKSSLNKIEVLKLAKQLGINIPDTIVTNNKEKLKKFFDSQNGSIICKSLFEIVYPTGVEEAGFLLRGLTEAIHDLDTLPDNFFPSLFQQNVEKKYELRVYYIDGKFYSTAMFTQKNDKTKQDFRNYDKSDPTRIVPYQLDSNLEDKLNALMQSMSLDNGSLDLIKGTDNKYYFLEINPVGQYEFISYPANYNLAKRNAEALIRKQYTKAKDVIEFDSI